MSRRSRQGSELLARPGTSVLARQGGLGQARFGVKRSGRSGRVAAVRVGFGRVVTVRSGVASSGGCGTSGLDMAASGLAVPVCHGRVGPDTVGPDRSRWVLVGRGERDAARSAESRLGLLRRIGLGRAGRVLVGPGEARCVWAVEACLGLACHVTAVAAWNDGASHGGAVAVWTDEASSDVVWWGMAHAARGACHGKASKVRE